jgi:hypothetical protein
VVSITAIITTTTIISSQRKVIAAGLFFDFGASRPKRR